MHNPIAPIIIFENDSLVVVNKPSGLLTVPDRFDGNLPSLKRMLRDKYGEIFVIHRIDRDTSGIIMFAKNDVAHKFYSMAFEERSIQKKYLGLVHGTPLQTSGTIDKPIAQHPVLKGKMYIHRLGKASVTHYRVVQNFGLYSLVEWQIETGRTHQIRVHMQDLGHPIVCDELYGTADPILLSRIKRKFKLSKNEEAERPLLNRLALHASSLEFTSQEGEQIHLEAPLFKDMQATLTQLGKNAK
jgi:23S rRNA pseudouridine955/2504/2580 synthase/23S rRNA pseudouridine1911/1915/1917 synthase